MSGRFRHLQGPRSVLRLADIAPCSRCAGPIVPRLAVVTVQAAGVELEAPGKSRRGILRKRRERRRLEKLRRSLTVVNAGAPKLYLFCDPCARAILGKLPTVDEVRAKLNALSARPKDKS